MIWFTSDLHLGHDKPFLYEPRGFTNVLDMNKTLIKNYNSVVKDDDEVYILGDLTLNELSAAKPYLAQLKGHIHVILGNHDTDNRINFYESLGWDCWDALLIKYNNYSFFLCHYPTITSNFGNTKKMTQAVINLYGHTHQKTNFFEDMPFCYHVGVDSHNNYPVNIEQVIQDIKEKLCK